MYADRFLRPGRERPSIAKKPMVSENQDIDSFIDQTCRSGCDILVIDVAINEDGELAIAAIPNSGTRKAGGDNQKKDEQPTSLLQPWLLSDFLYKTRGRLLTAINITRKEDIHPITRFLSEEDFQLGTLVKTPVSRVGEVKSLFAELDARLQIVPVIEHTQSVWIPAFISDLRPLGLPCFEISSSNLAEISDAVFMAHAQHAGIWVNLKNPTLSNSWPACTESLAAHLFAKGVTVLEIENHHPTSQVLESCSNAA